MESFTNRGILWIVRVVLIAFQYFPSHESGDRQFDPESKFRLYVSPIIKAQNGPRGVSLTVAAAVGDVEAIAAATEPQR